MTVRVVSIPRDGSSEEENEDAAAWHRDASRLVACVADGATESVYSRPWGRAIAQGFVQDAPIEPAALEQNRIEWQKTWRAGLPSGRQPWYVSNRIDEGSHAAFVGVVIDDDEVRAIAVGDCCILWCVEGEVVSWPISSVDQFDSRPSLLATDIALGRAHVAHFQLPDRLVMASDAAAEWLLRTGIDDLTSEDIASRVTLARANRSLRNDDTTIVIIDR